MRLLTSGLCLALVLAATSVAPAQLVKRAPAGAPAASASLGTGSRVTSSPRIQSGRTGRLGAGVRIDRGAVAPVVRAPITSAVAGTVGAGDTSAGNINPMGGVSDLVVSNTMGGLFDIKFCIGNGCNVGSGNDSKQDNKKGDSNLGHGSGNKENGSKNGNGNGTNPKGSVDEKTGNGGDEKSDDDPKDDGDDDESDGMWIPDYLSQIGTSATSTTASTAATSATAAASTRMATRRAAAAARLARSIGARVR